MRSRNRADHWIGRLPLAAIAGLAALLALPGPAHAAVKADFNRDGIDDLAIGVPNEDKVGTLTVTDAGAVHVIYGSSSGLQAGGTAAPNDEVWYQGGSGLSGTPDPYDHFGAALAVGDFNHDTFDDLAIGVPGEDFESGGTIIAEDAGVVHVLYGAPGGLQASNDQVWYQGGYVRDEAENGDRFGSALVAGDFNHDTFDDLAIGVPGETVNGMATAGAVNVLYGWDGGLQAKGLVAALDDQFWHQDSTGVGGVAEPTDEFGFALAAGDFNHDDREDLAIGVPGEGIRVGTVDMDDAGAVHVLYGSDTGLQATGTGGPNDDLFYQGSGGIADDPSSGDRFGFALAIGHFDIDDYADLAIGVPFESLDDGTTYFYQAGVVHVLYGSASGLYAPQTGVPDDHDQLWFQGKNGVVLDAPDADDHFGYALAAGRFNNSCCDDLAIGVPGQWDVGAVHVLHGSPNRGLQATDTGSDDDELWVQGYDGVANIAESGDEFGLTLAAGDFDGNTWDDLAIGVPGEDVNPGTGVVYDAGAVAVLYASSGGLQATGDYAPNDQLWYQGKQHGAGALEGALRFDNRFGSALSAPGRN